MLAFGAGRPCGIQGVAGEKVEIVEGSAKEQDVCKQGRNEKARYRSDSGLLFGVFLLRR